MLGGNEELGAWANEVGCDFERWGGVLEVRFQSETNVFKGRKMEKKAVFISAVILAVYSSVPATGTDLEITATIASEGGIWLSPTGFDVNIIEGCTLTETLTVGNDGFVDLDYMIRTRVVSNAGGSWQASVNKGRTRQSPIGSIPEGHDFTVAADAAYEPGELIVRFAAKADGKQLNSIEKDQILASLGGGVVKRSYSLVRGLSVIELPEGVTVEQALRSYNKADGILYAEPNYRVKALSTIPNDTRFNDLWGMHNTGQTGGTPDADIDAPQAWDISTGNSQVVVAVIDTGVDYHHVDLADNMWINEPEYNGTPGVDDDDNGYIDDIYGYDFRNNDGDPMDDHYHGTHCAGTIGAVGNNSEGVAGVCWDVRIMAVKFLSSGGSGSTEDAISCVQYTTLMGANLSSNSWGGGGYSQGLKDAIDAAGAAGMLFVASAGNDDEDTDVRPHYPSSYDSESLISVMSTNHSDSKSGFSNWGPVSVDLGAPGSDILSCQLGGGYKYASGTSMAGPHVAGACALLWSMNLAMTNAEVKDILIRTVDPTLAGQCVSEGRLNLYNAILETRAPWIHIEPEEGMIGAGDSCDVSVTFDAISMEPGVYEAEIVIISTDPCRPQTTVPVTMTVSLDDLQVTPAEGFDSIGTKGGPFEPQCISYTLTNVGVGPVNWTTFETEGWLEVIPHEGVLGVGERREVDVCISAAADLLDPNLYGDVLVFQNADSNSIKPRPITLIVKPPDMFTQSFGEGGSDLDGLMLTFTPDGSVAYYEACRERISEFGTDPNGGTYVPLWDDDFVEVVLIDDANVLFYGQRYDRFYIGSNGYVTYGNGDSAYAALLENHFARPRISGLFADLNPPHAECISYKQLDDRVVVTFEDVPLWEDKDATSSFQIEMFFVDGTIRVTWLESAGTASVSGLSEGKGLPPVFFEQSNLDEYPACWPPCDLYRDYLINFKDVAVLANYWLHEDCYIPYWCGRSDFDFSGTTDTLDLRVCADNWLTEMEKWWLWPVSHWMFDEGEGEIAYDAVGANHGRLVNGPVWIAGQIDGALNFDGTDDYVDVNDHSSLRFNQYDSFSMSLWATPVSSGWLLCKMRATSCGEGIFGYELKWHASTFSFVVEKSCVKSVVASTLDDSAPVGAWYHVACVYDNKAMQIYLNGRLHGSATFGYDTGWTTPDKNLAIGARSYDSTVTAHFGGTIDDVHIYDRALSVEEIAQMYREGLGGRAFYPNPPHGALDVDPNTILSWSPGPYALSHDVYLGTDYNDVNDANTSAEPYRGNYDVNSYDPSGLDTETTYYWRIDERGSQSTIKGDVWRFRTYDPNLDLVSWWKFDEGEGTTAYDSAGTNHGTIHGATWTSGQIGGALDFDGTDDYVDVDDDTSLRFSQYDSFSMSFWAAPISPGYVLCKMRASNCYGGIFGYQAGWNDAKFHLVIEKSCVKSVIVYTLDNSAPPGAWYHVTCVYDNKDMKIYLDGDLQGSGTFGYDTGVSTPDKNLAIGARSFDSTITAHFEGTIDDVKIYNRALSAQEIRHLYEQ
jgi:subtilisin family serine protease